MKRVAIFLRKKLAENKFRDVILGALRNDEIDNALLCSGFFQEDNTYSVSALFDITSHRKSKLNLTTVGLYTYGDKKKYETFIANLIKNNCAAKFEVLPKQMPGMKWHAKVFIAKKKSRPAIAVIGSSNITRRAFDTLKDFNYECDVIFWNEQNKEINKLISSLIDDVSDEGNSSIIVTNYDKRHPANRTPLSDRLSQLEKEILEMIVDMKSKKTSESERKD